MKPAPKPTAPAPPAAPTWTQFSPMRSLMQPEDFNLLGQLSRDPRFHRILTAVYTEMMATHRADDPSLYVRNDSLRTFVNRIINFGVEPQKPRARMPGQMEPET